MDNNLIFSIVATIILFTGIITLFYVISLFSKAAKSKNWPFIKGFIISSEVIELHDSTEKGKYASTYRNKILFKYKVNEKEFLSSNLFWGSKISDSSLDDKKEYASKYTEGMEVDIYYNPDKPHQAVIEPGIKFVLYLNLIFALFILLMGCFCIKYFLCINPA